MGLAIIPSSADPFFRNTIIGSRTYDGTAGNGATGAATFFTVTGEILVAALIPFCVVSLEEALATASITLGVTGLTTLFSPNPTGGATAIDANEFWFDATPVTQLAVPATHKDIAISADILTQIATQAVNGGTLRLTLLWLPLSADAAVSLASGVS